MPVDYVPLRSENVTKYGKDMARVGRLLLSQMHSERTHFIFELLQNADDAGVTAVYTTGVKTFAELVSAIWGTELRFEQVETTAGLGRE